MLRRVPPVLLALAATVVLAVGVVLVFVATGGAQGRQVASCTAAQDDGPYGCIVLVSVDGSVGGRRASEPEGGAITISFTRTGGADRVTFSGGCGTTSGPARVTATSWRIGSTGTTGAGCTADERARGDWAAALLAGAVRVTDRDDGTLELAHGDRRARFTQVIAPRG